MSRLQSLRRVRWRQTGFDSCKTLTLRLGNLYVRRGLLSYRAKRCVASRDLDGLLRISQRRGADPQKKVGFIIHEKK